MANVSKEVIVFVHGLFGFGRDELFGMGYWKQSEQFQNNGFKIFEASVGPVSSNYDRACELYAQIKGTKTDYGAIHSNLYKHNRYGPDYTNIGMYPEWGSTCRIHFIGHSMGGSTIRMLEYLLHEGVDDESSDFPFSSKNGNWIKSITTVATPHNGTPLIDLFGRKTIYILKKFFFTLNTFANNTIFEKVYDFNLDHFELCRKIDENNSDYINRVINSEIWNSSFKDLAPWDLSIEGCKEFQEISKNVYPDTYYFGYAADQTFKCGRFYLPSWKMGAMFVPTSLMIGFISQLPNDCAVPTNSSKCPGEICKLYEDEWLPEIWYYSVINRDHMQSIGFTSDEYDEENLILFDIHAKRLQNLK